MTSIQTTDNDSTENDTYELVSVDAWSSDGSYTWNAWYSKGVQLPYAEVPKDVVSFLTLLASEGFMAEDVETFAHHYSVEVDNNCERGNVTLYLLPTPCDICGKTDDEQDEDDYGNGIGIDCDELHAPEPVFSFIYKH